MGAISLLAEVKDKLVNKITLQLPLSGLDDTMVSELSALIKNNSGNSLLYFEVVDGERNMKVDLFSRSYKINVKQELIDYLIENESFVFKVN